MGVNQPSEVTFACDGPGCEETAPSMDSVTVPLGWIRIYGHPPIPLGEYVFHSGACHDAWWSSMREAYADQST